MSEKKQYFIASLCKNGILGGGITVDEEAIIYHTNKLTVSDRYRRLEMRFEEIESVSAGRLSAITTVLIKMKKGEVYKFLVFFGRNRFADTLSKYNIYI